MERKVKVGDKFSSLSEVGATCPEGTKLRKVVHATARGEFAASEWTNGYEVVELPDRFPLPKGAGAVIWFTNKHGGKYRGIRIGSNTWSVCLGGAQAPRTWSEIELRSVLYAGGKITEIASEGVAL